jgi:two-component system response regulator YesN
MFSRLMGIRPTDYLNKKRIEKSQMLLLCSGKKLKEIALDVGFADPNYFSRVFKKYTGLSPQEYIHTVTNGPAKIK